LAAKCKHLYLLVGSIGACPEGALECQVPRKKLYPVSERLQVLDIEG